MRRLPWNLALLGAALAAPAPLAAQVPAGAQYDEHEAYSAAVSEFYGMPLERTPRSIDPDELPVIYLLAREARVSPLLIIALREQGWSWIDITHELGVDPYLYVERLPYSSGYWRRYSARELRYLTDRHVIDYVNLCFWADYHRRPVTQIIVIRERIPTWRYYVRYHTPPRTVARGVYVVRTPGAPRRDPPRGVNRYAQPRDEWRRDDPQRRAVARVGRDARVEERRSLPSQPATTRPATGVRRDAPPGSRGDAPPPGNAGRTGTRTASGRPGG
jgi:hypothetical protein